MKGIYLCQRMKTPSAAALHTSEAINTSGDQSRGDSSSKRFSRKQGHHLQNSRTCKTPKMIDLQIKQHLEQSRPTVNQKPKAYISSGFIRQEDLFLKISHTPSRGPLFTPPISTDRNTESTAFTKPNGLETPFDTPTTKKDRFSDLEEEIEVKNGQILLLQDQNIRLRSQIQHIQSQNLKLRVNQQKQYQLTLKKLQGELQKLKAELADKNQHIKKMIKNETSLSRELKGVKYEKLLVEKQLDEIYKKRLPKQLRDLMSYREVSLLNQVEQLRKELQKEKSEKEKLMETQISYLKQKNSEKQTSLKKLQIHSHMLNKKVIDTEQSLKAHQEQFKQCFSDLQETNVSLVDQLKRTRKQNLKLQRLHLLTSQQGRRKPNNLQLDDSDSLSISVSPRSPRQI